MKTVTLVVVLLFFGALHIQAQSGRTDRHRMRAEQLSYEEFAKSVERTRSRLTEFREFTRLLFEHCNLEKVRERGLFDTYGLPKDTTVIFEVPLAKLDEYSILDWPVQYIGFENLMLSITGYGLVSRAEILRLKVENMKLSNAPADTTRKLELRYLEAQKELDEYLATQRWVD